MSKNECKRSTEEFKIEAVKQVVKRNYKISDVANRLGVTTKSIHNWIDKYGKLSLQHETIDTQQDELRKIRTQLRQVTEARDILKEAAVDSSCPN